MERPYYLPPPELARKIAQLRDDEGRVFDLITQACVIVALSTVCLLAAVIAIKSAFSGFTATFILVGFHGIFYGLYKLEKALKLKKGRYSAGYRIEALQLDRGAFNRRAKSAYRAHVYAPDDELIGVLIEQRDVESIIEHHIKGKELPDFIIEHRMVPEFAMIKAADDKARSARNHVD